MGLRALLGNRNQGVEQALESQRKGETERKKEEEREREEEAEEERDLH